MKSKRESDGFIGSQTGFPEFMQHLHILYTAHTAAAFMHEAQITSGSMTVLLLHAGINRTDRADNTQKLNLSNEHLLITEQTWQRDGPKRGLRWSYKWEVSIVWKM